MESQDRITPLAERRRPGSTAALALVLVAAAGLWISSLVASRWGNDGSLPGELINALIFYVPFITLPVAVYSGRRGGLSDALRMNPLPLLPALTVMFLGAMSVYAASTVDALWTALLNALGLHIPQAGVEMATPQALTAEILLTAALPAICEELLFRGVVFSAFEGRGTWRGLWISSALFALMHGNLFGLPAYLLVGAASAFIVYAVDSLYAGMLYHTAYNATILVIVYLSSRQATAAEEAALSPGPLALDLVITGALIVSSLMTLNLRRRLLGIEPVPRAEEPLPRRDQWMLALVAAVLVIDIAVIQVLTEAGL